MSRWEHVDRGNIFVVREHNWIDLILPANTRALSIVDNDFPEPGTIQFTVATASVGESNGSISILLRLATYLRPVGGPTRR